MEAPLNTTDSDFYSKLVRDKVKSLNPPAGDLLKDHMPEGGKQDDLHYTGTGSIRKAQPSEVI